MSRNEQLPEHVRGQPLEIQVAVLYERVGNLGQEVRNLKRALWAFVFSILGGGILFLLSVAVGWLGPRTHTVAEMLIGMFT